MLFSNICYTHTHTHTLW